jgi:hypothetical protein
VKLYTSKAIAGFLDLTERRVRQLRDMRVIEECREGGGLYDLVPTAHRYINYLRRRNPESAESIDYNTVRAKLIRAKRMNEEYDLKVKEGDLHSSDDVETVFKAMLVNFRNHMTALPSRLSPTLAKKTNAAEIFRILKSSIDEAMAELADFDGIEHAVHENEENND